MTKIRFNVFIITLMIDYDHTSIKVSNLQSDGRGTILDKAMGSPLSPPSPPKSDKAKFVFGSSQMLQVKDN